MVVMQNRLSMDGLVSELLIGAGMNSTLPLLSCDMTVCNNLQARRAQSHLAIMILSTICSVRPLEGSIYACGQQIRKHARPFCVT